MMRRYISNSDCLCERQIERRQREGESGRLCSQQVCFDTLDALHWGQTIAHQCTHAAFYTRISDTGLFGEKLIIVLLSRRCFRNRTMAPGETHTEVATQTAVW